MKEEELKFREVNGRRLYFPWGIGKAYVLPSASAETRLKSWIKARRMGMFVIQLVLIVGALQLHFKLVATLFAIIVVDALLWTISNRVIFQGLEVTSDRSNAEELARKVKQPEGFAKIIGVLTGCLAFVAAGIFIYSRGQADQKTVAIVCIAFFGLGAIVACAQLIGKIKGR